MIYQRAELLIDINSGVIMKVRASVKKICVKCKVIKRKGVVGLSVKILSINNDKVKIKRSN